jgi:endoglucanase Acf2
MNRQFDHFAGHHYASGHAAFANGNNQESSSEAMRFSSAVALWAMVTKQDALRDYALYAFASERVGTPSLLFRIVVAIEEYWFNKDRDNFPPEFSPPYASVPHPLIRN